MSLRSKVVIENNLKPSQFGKPVTPSGSDKNDDFDEVYEDPLEKSKPLPPKLDIMNIAGNLTHELQRNEPGTMEFSNASKNIRDSNLYGGNTSSSNRYSIENHNGDDRQERIINERNSLSQRNSKADNYMQQGFTNDAFVDENFEQKLINHSSTSNDKLVTIESQGLNRTMALNNNGKNGPEDNPDISFRTVINVIKSLDVNRYATKKTIAQGMLDIALLTANASQLKYILQVGNQHEFYILMLSLIGVSIGLQVIQGVICVLLGSSLNINKQQDQKKANVWNNICLVLMVLTVAVNAVISAFDMRDNSAIKQSNITKGSATTRLASGGR